MKKKAKPKNLFKFGLLFVTQKHETGINSNGLKECYRENLKLFFYLSPINSGDSKLLECLIIKLLINNPIKQIISF